MGIAQKKHGNKKNWDVEWGEESKGIVIQDEVWKTIWGQMRETWI